MIVKLSDWLISTARLYPSNVVCCRIVVGSIIRDHAVSLLYLTRDASANTITAVWHFTTNTGNVINTTTIRDIFHLTGMYFSITGLNIVIPLSYTWGQVVLHETVTLIGAV
jgi:hypothetical protein